MKRKRKQERKVARKKETLRRKFSPHWRETPRVSQTRSAIKTIIYRALSGLETVLLAWFVVPTFGVGVFGALDLLGNTIFYYTFERVWSYVELWDTRRRERKS